MTSRKTQTPPTPPIYVLDKRDLEAAQRAFLHVWKGEASQRCLALALCKLRMTPHSWTAGNILFMMSFYFRYREKDRHTIWILNEKGQHEPKDATWFEEQCSLLKGFTFQGLRLPTIWFMFAYKFFEKKGHLLPPICTHTPTPAFDRHEPAH
jgi:hypothetical protein